MDVPRLLVFALYLTASCGLFTAWWLWGGGQRAEQAPRGAGLGGLLGGQDAEPVRTLRLDGFPWDHAGPLLGE
jgi:hypothetical protein